MSAPASLDTYDYAPPGRLARLLWWCAGADGQLLARCPYSDRVKFQGLGGVVLATGFLAFLSGSYAFYTVFAPKVGVALDPAQQATHWPSAIEALLAGLVWSLVIFNLDRFIVASTGKGDGTDKITLGELGRALPRIVMAFIIGICLSAPLEIRILESEIESELQNVQRREFEQRRTAVESDWKPKEDRLAAELASQDRQVADILARVTAQEAVVGTMQRRVEDEVAGDSGSGRRGVGPAYKEKKENFELAKHELERERVEAAGVQARIAKAKAATEAQVAALLADKAKAHEEIQREVRGQDGLLQRIKISHDIGGMVPWAIMFLLLSIELGPIFFKMMLIKGAYDYLEENQKKLVSARAGVAPDARLVPSADGSNRAYRIDVFHGPEALLERERLALETTSTLTQQVHEAFRKVTSADIAANPQKYVEDGAPAAPSTPERS